MKKFYKILSLLLVLPMLAISCKDEELVYEIGEAEAEDCVGIFFPSQEAAGEHEVDPADPTEVTIKISRKNSEAAVTVPYTITATSNGEVVEGVFTGDDIVFEEGQTETVFKVYYAGAEVGVPYTCSVAVNDKQYASIYGQGNTQITFSITRVKWNNLGKGLMRDDFLGGVLGTYCSPANPVWEVTFYERDDQKGLYRIYDAYNNAHIENWLVEGVKVYREGVDDDFYFILDARNPKKVWIPYVCIGWQFYSNGPFYIGSLVDENIENCPDISGYTSASNYGSVDANGLITFPERSQCYGFSADEWWGRSNTNSMLYFAPPGVTPVDYSLKLEANLTESGVTPIAVTTGIDVTSIKYAVYEGELTAKEANAIGANILADNEEVAEFTELVANAKGTAKTGALGVTAEATGKYTIVAVSYDEEGKGHNTAYAAFTYVAGEDAVPVVLNCGIEATDKYVPKGYTAENSLEFYVYGEELTDVKITLVRYLDFVKMEWEDIVAAVKSLKSVDAPTLEKINGDGYVDVAKGLSPGTEYYLLVWATNGYEEDIFYANATTEGDPLPIYQTFTDDDYDETAELEDASQWVGTWNMYGVDFDETTTGMRDFLGKATISMSDTPTEGPDSYGYYDEYVYINGMFGNTSWIKNYVPTWDDTYEMDVYGGCMYAFQNTLVNDALGDCEVLFYAKEKGTWGWDYVSNYFGLFIPVADGYFAFIDGYYAAAYNFCGLGIYSSNAGGWLARVYDQLLVDPAKDDNGIAPASVNRQAKIAKEKINKYVVEALENGQNQKVAIRTAIDKYMKEYKNSLRYRFTPAGLTIEREAKQAKGVTVKAIDWTPKVNVPASTPVAPAKSR